MNRGGKGVLGFLKTGLVCNERVFSDINELGGLRLRGDEDVPVG